MDELTGEVAAIEAALRSTGDGAAVEKLMLVHKSQLLTYLKLSGCKLGYLLNFNVPHMRDGISRVVNGL